MSFADMKTKVNLLDPRICKVTINKDGKEGPKIPFLIDDAQDVYLKLFITEANNATK